MASHPVFPDSLQRFSFVYMGIGILEITAGIMEESFPYLHYVSKPLIMISLSIFFFYQMFRRLGREYYLMQAAILFSLMGDIFLMFSGNLFFQLGLGSFLVAQILYCIVFSLAPRGEVGAVLKRRPWLVLPFLAYAISLLYVLSKGVGEMFIPVAIYAFALTTMVLLALNRWRRVHQDSFAYVFLGALLFMISDSMIAISRFAGDLLPIPLSGVWIMLTYIAAQYLIVIGMLIQLRSAKHPD